MIKKLPQLLPGLLFTIISWYLLTTPTVAQAVSLNSFEATLIQQINQQRQSNGLSTLNTSSLLTTAARNHNSTVANCATQFGLTPCFTHQATPVDEPSTWDRIVAIGYNPQANGENIAWGQTSPDAVITAWMNSAGHKANILGNFNDIGCGFLDKNNGKYDGMYWTCDFGKSFSVQPSNTPQPTASPSVKPTSTPTPTPKPTKTPRPTSTPAPTPTISPSPTPIAAPSPSPTSTPKPWYCFYIPNMPGC